MSGKNAGSFSPGQRGHGRRLGLEDVDGGALGFEAIGGWVAEMELTDDGPQVTEYVKLPHFRQGNSEEQSLLSINFENVNIPSSPIQVYRLLRLLTMSLI